MKRSSLLLSSCVAFFLYFSHIGFCQSEARTVRFKTGSFAIDAKYLPVLNDFGQRAATDSFLFLKIFSYSDKAGTKKYNEQLSAKRANAVFDYLTTKFSIDTSKIYVTWLGEETDGAYDLHFPSANVQQRCVDLLIYFRKPG